MQPRAQYKKILCLVKRIQAQPGQYKEALKANRLALRLADEIISQLERGDDPGLGETLRWNLPGDADLAADWSEGSCPRYQLVGTLAQDIISLFVALAGFDSDRFTASRRVRRIRKAIRPEEDAPE